MSRKVKRLAIAIVCFGIFFSMVSFAQTADSKVGKETESSDQLQRGPAPVVTDFVIGNLKVRNDANGYPCIIFEVEKYGMGSGQTVTVDGKPARYFVGEGNRPIYQNGVIIGSVIVYECPGILEPGPHTIRVSGRVTRERVVIWNP